MSCNRYEPSQTCGEITESNCIRVETTFPEISGLTEVDCASGKVVIDDIYSILSTFDISEYDKLCLEIDEISLLNVLQAQTVKICDLENRVAFLEEPCNILGMDISSCGIDVSCLLNDACDTPIAVTTIGALFQTLVSEICILKSA